MATKKGRKKKSESVVAQNGMYFGERQEKAVLDFLTCLDPLEKDRIFTKELKKPLDKMIESIIRRYKLYVKNYSFEDLHSDTFSFLMTKIEKFDPSANKKAYSYFGTIIKNYLLGKILKQDKEMKQNLSYEDIYMSIEENEKYSYCIDKPEGSYDEFIIDIANKIEEKITNKGLNENEMKVAFALIDILKNWESIFIDTAGSSDKFNKNKVLSHIRDYTLMSTKDIRISMKKFKEIYGNIKIFRIDEGLL
jgi:hypothetical protein